MFVRHLMAGNSCDFVLRSNKCKAVLSPKMEMYLVSSISFARNSDRSPLRVQY